MDTASIGPGRGLARGSDVSRVKPSRPPDRDVVYKKTPQGDLKMFAYFPDGWTKRDRHPVIVFFHGGAWTQGSPEQFYGKAEYLASRGMVALCAQYRLYGVHGTTVERCLEDARSAMRYVRRRAAEWGVDGERLASSGGSAGAHLAVCCALLDGPDDKSDDLTVSCRPQALVLFNPVLDTDSLRQRPDIAQFLPRFSGTTAEEKDTSLRALSPIEHLKAGCPPGVAFYGTRDEFLASARVFARKSTALGNRIELWTAEGMPHGFFNGSPWHQTTTRKVDEFLTSLGYLRGRPAMQLADEKAVLRKELPLSET